MRWGLVVAAVLLCGCAAGKQGDSLEQEERRRAKLELQNILEMASNREIPPVDFEFDSAELLPSSSLLLDRIVDILQRAPDLKLIVEGHTDDVGSVDYNQKLSVERAGAVKTYLTQQGVYPDTVKVYGFGKSRPVTKDTSDRGRALNRRVEFILTTRDWEAVY
ncbi:MAG: OmpA family protein [Elusimicrobia bacterium]|nr:OmpA family protein [Elusimicrobiota bacterium]